MTTIIDSDIQLLPLEEYMKIHQIEKLKTKSVLLSRFKCIPSDLLEQLERSNIFDTGDLALIEDNRFEIFGLPVEEVNQLRLKIKKEEVKLNNQPQLILNLPENFSIIFMKTVDTVVTIEVYWKGLLFWWKLRTDRLDRFLCKINDFLKMIDQPELLSFTSRLPEMPTLEYPIYDISIYIGNIDYSRSIEEIGKSLNIKSDLESKYQCYETLILAYLIDLIKS